MISVSRINLPVIQPHPYININRVVGRILQAKFSEYRRLIVKADFSSSSHSGSNVYVVQPIRPDGMPALPTVVKIASISLIKKEWLAYRGNIHDVLSRVAKIRGDPVLCQESGYGCLCYDLFGEGIFKIKPLKEFAIDADIRDLCFVIDEQLLPNMRQIWSFFREPRAEIPLQVCYDQVLPVNLRIEPKPLPPEAKPVLIQPGTSPPEVQKGDFVRLKGFVVTKVDLERQTITLNWPQSDTMLPESCFVRLQSVKAMSAYQINQPFPAITGRVVETRWERLYREAEQALGQKVELSKSAFELPNGKSLPNPLQALPDILNQTRTIRISRIHGDLNLGNILVELETHRVGLIDFAEARRDYVLLDFLRLETEVVTHLVAKLIHQHRLPLLPTVCRFYQHLHDATLDHEFITPEWPHPDLERPFTILKAVRRAMRCYLFDRDDCTEYYQGLIPHLLGALKFDNLDRVPEAPTPKQAAFWSAAAVNRLSQGRTVLPADPHSNPFGDVGRITDPKRFFDRERQLKRIFYPLARGQNVSLVGKAEIGKSSILSMICNLGPERLGWPQQAFVYLNLECVYDEDDFFKELCRRLSIEPCRGGKLRHVLREKQRGLHVAYHILCLDEVEKLNYDGFSKALRSELRGLSDGTDAPLTLVTASRRSLSDIFDDLPDHTSPLANIFYIESVRPFFPKVARAFLDHRLRGTGVTFTEAETENLLTQSNCEPAKLQRMAKDLYGRKTRGAR